VPTETPQSSVQEKLSLFVLKKIKIKMLTIWQNKDKVRNSAQGLCVCVFVCVREREGSSAETQKKKEILLTDLVALFVRFLQPHPPLIV